MTVQIKKILSLNLALFLLVMTAVPVFAADEVVTSPAEPYAGEKVLSGKLQEGEASVKLLEESEPYYIQVGSSRFLSDENQSGTNWTYTAETNVLVLNGYSGASVRASGDLAILTGGNVTISGADGTNYGSDGIEVDGDLMIGIMGGSLTVTGGDGNRQGGDAVAVYGELQCYSYGTTSFTGGQTYLSSYNNDMLFGGDALFASSAVRLRGSGITAVGGKGSSLSPGSGGSAILSSRVYVYADCDLQGGSGYYGGSGIYFSSYCTFGLVNADIRCGSGTVRYGAILNGNDYSWYYHPHTTVHGTSNWIWIDVNEYTLDLWGMGGVTGGRATFTSLTDYYPAEYVLADYMFTRNGYTQVAWRTTGGSLVPLNTVYCPEKNTRLMAEWLAAENGDIVLNGNGGKTQAGDLYKNYGSNTVTLPDITYKEDTLLGWSTVVAPKENSDLQLSGQWYTSGYTVKPDADRVQTLYAQPESTGQYALFHPTEGTVSAGGNVLVYGTLSTSSDLQVTAPGKEQVTAPKDYELAGWSSTKQAAEVEYAPGETIPLEVGETQHFYAQWKPLYYDAFLGGISFYVAPAINEVRVVVPKDLSGATEVSRCMVALYNRDGKMLACDMTVYQTGSDSELILSVNRGTIAYGKVFLLDENNQPVKQAVECDMTPVFTE